MLYIPPSGPAHGFVPVALVSFGYLGLVLGSSYALWLVGAPDILVGAAAVAVAIGLFRPYLSVSRRLTPDPPDVE